MNRAGNNSSEQAGRLQGGGGSWLGLQDEQDSEGWGKSKQKPGGRVNRPAWLPRQSWDKQGENRCPIH